MHPYPNDKDSAIEWAIGILENRDHYLILDTETTGLGRNDVVIQIAIIDLDGNVLLDSLVRPTKRKRISKEATAIHGIRMSDLKDQPTMGDLLDQISSIIKGKTVLIYNEEYDHEMLFRTCEQDEIMHIHFFSTRCVMLQYSKFAGKWNDYYGDYTYQRLPSGDHSAVGDCKATLKVIEKMAKATLSKHLGDAPVNIGNKKSKPVYVLPPRPKKQWWEFWK